MQERVELIAAGPLAPARPTTHEIEDAKEGHAALILGFEEEPFEGPARLVAVPRVWVEGLLDCGQGVREGEVATSLDDDERLYLSRTGGTAPSSP